MPRKIQVFILSCLLASFAHCLGQTASEQAQKTTISGMIVSEEGFPVSNALIITLDCSLTSLETYKSDGEGKFLFEIDPGQICLIRIQKDGFIPIDIRKASLISKSRDFSFILQKASKLSGTVLDGVSLAPLKGVQVKLQREQDAQGAETAAAARTDEAGRYTFSNMSGGRYSLKVEKESYIPYSDGFSLKGGEPRSSSIFLFKQGSLNGFVKDPEQKAIPGAEIKLLKNLSLFFKERGKIFQGGDCKTESAENGRFSIKDIPEYSGYRISISSEGFAPRIIETDINAGDNALIINLQKASSIRGTVKDDKGKILDDADVEIKPHNEETLQGLTHIFQKKYHPTETGLFRIGDMPSGSFTLTISSAGHISETHEVRNLKTGEDRDLGNIKLSQGLRISGSVKNEKVEKVSTARIEASLSGSGGKPYAKSAESEDDGSFSVTGLKEGIYSVHVEADGYIKETKQGIRAGASNLIFTLKAAGTIKGTVRGEDGNPLPTFYIAIDPEQKTADNENKIYRSFTSETGAYEIGRLKPGLYTVSAEAAGFSEDSKKGVEVFAGLETDKVNFSLRRGAKIDGFVYDKEQGLPVPGASISVLLTSRAYEALSAATDTGGYFSLDGVPLKAISIVAEHPDYAPAIIKDIDPTGKESAFPLKIYLETGGSVEGYILEADDAPVYGARLSISPPGKWVEALSDMSGYYHIDHIPAGTHSITKTVPRLDYYSDYESKEFTIKNNDIVRVDFKSFTEASGYVTRKGAPMGGARVTFIEAPTFPGFDSSKLSARSSFADSTGFYRIKGLKEGRYSIVVENAEKRCIKIAEIPKVKEFRYDIAYPEFEISGRVIDGETRMPIPLASVAACLAETKVTATFDMEWEIDGVLSKITGATGEMQTTTTDSEGSFSLLVEKPGQYYVTALSTGYLRKPISITVSQNTSPLEIAIYKGSILKGTVRSERGTFPSTANIQMVREGYSFGTSVGAGGRFVFDDLDPATYTLYIFAPSLAPLIAENLKIESGKVYEEEYIMKEGAPLKLAVSPANKALNIKIIDAAGRDFFNLFLLYLEEEISVEEENGKTVYAFPNLPPGVYKVIVTAKKISKDKTIEIFNGTPASIDFEF